MNIATCPKDGISPSKIVSSRRGFTLVEALLASVILAIGLFAVGLAIYTEFAFIYQNRERAIAALAAQEEIENIRGMPFDTVKNLGSTFSSTGFAYLKDPVGTLTVENSYGSDIKKISVRVSWSSLAGRTLETRLATLVARNGINKQ